MDSALGLDLRQKAAIIGHYVAALTPLIVGLITFAIACGISGRVVSRFSHFDDFTRFFFPVQPQTQYYPSASQLLRTALLSSPTSKILVLVGGDSVFRGAGQNASELWTKHLQRNLGDDYSVLNYSTDQVAVNSFAGVAYRILSRFYPRLIYVGTTDALRAFDELDGFPPYKYLFWDAYYKGLFDAGPDEASMIRKVRRRELATWSGLRLHVVAFLDSLLYFSSIRNELAYRLVSPDWTVDNLPWRFSARRNYQDADDPNIPTLQQQAASAVDHEKYLVGRMTMAMSNVFDFSQTPPQVRPVVMKGMLGSYESAFPKAMRNRIINFVLSPNPRYLAFFDEQQRQAYQILLQTTADAMKAIGYRSIIARQDFAQDDFVDNTHLMPSGGRRLAIEVAVAVEAVAQQLGYH